MKHRTSWIWTVPALALMASPLCLDKIAQHLGAESVYRSIASDEAQPQQPEQQVAQPQQPEQQVAQPQQPEQQVAQPQQPEQQVAQPQQPEQQVAQPQGPEVRQEVVALTDAQKLTQLKTDLSGEKVKAEELKPRLDEAHTQLMAASESDSTAPNKIKELETLVNEHSNRLSELEARLKGLEGSATLTGADLASGKQAYEDVKKITDELKAKLLESNNKIAANASAVRQREELARQRETEVTNLTAENRRLKQQHDLFVCQQEEKSNEFLKKIEELNKQQQQFTTMITQINQMWAGMLMQTLQMRSGQQQPQTFATSMLGQPQGLGQQYSPSNLVQGSYLFTNPWQQQQQPQNVYNFYGPQGMQMPGMQMPGMQQQGQLPGMMGMGQMGMQQPGMPFLPYQQSNFGFASVVDDSARGMFGNLQSMAQPAMPIVPQG